MIFLFLSLKKVTISMITPVQEAYTEVFSVLRVVLCCFNTLYLATTSQTLKSKHGRWKSSLSAQPLEVKPMSIRNNSVEIAMY